MRLLTDNRAQSIQIGAVLLFGVLIILLATWQAFVIPDQNERIEFNHNQDVQQQMTELRTTVNSMPDAAVTRSATVDLGVRYPSRAIFRNPPAATGTLETLETTDSGYNISIENATATEDSIADFWDGGLREYNSGAIAYRPRYNEYSNAPRTIYEHSVLYNKFEREQQELSSTGQTLVRDDRITIVALNGSLRQDRVDSTSIDFDPISTQTRTVQISNESHNITLSAPTAMNEGEWREVFSDELTDNGGNVRDISTTELEEFDEFSLLRITLEPGEYSLQMAKVGVGTGATSETESYLTDVGGTEFDIDHDETQDVTVEVRDRFNKPLRGVEINAEAENADDFPESKTTGQDGQATFTYDPETAGQGQTNKLNFTFEDLENFDPDDPESVQMDVTVKKEEEREPGETLYDVLWNQAAIGSQSGVECTDGDCTYEAIEATSNFIQLDMFTDSPAVSGASVDYSLGSGQDGVIDPWEGTTDEEGENSTTLHPNGDGNFDAYVTSGNDADELSIDVSGLPPRADDLLLHLDAYTIDQNNETGVAEWQDRTVNEFDATVGEGSEPTYIEDTNAAELTGPTINFNNNNGEFLETDWQPSEDDGLDEGLAVFTVVRVASEGEGGSENPGVLGASGDGFDLEPRLYQSVDGIEPWSGVGDLPDGGGAIDRDEFVIFTTHYDGTDVRLFVDGQLQHQFGPATFSGTSNEFLIGAISGGATYWDNFDGDISEVLVYNEDISEEREDIESYLEEKWFAESAESNLENLDIAEQGDDATITEGENEDVSVDITNVGDLNDNFDVTLTIDDGEGDPEVDETEENVAVDAGETESVTFTEVTGELDPEEYTVEVSTDDDSVSGTLTVVVETGSFSGIVQDENEDPVDEEVTFEDSTGVVLGSATPDPGDGSYIIENVPVGTYDITAIADGFEPDTVNNVEIEEDQTTEDVNFELITSDEAEPELSNLDIADQGADATITEGDDETISVDVDNIGAQSGSFTIELLIDNGQTVTDSETTGELDPGDDETVTFTGVTDGLDPDDYTVTVQDEDDTDSEVGDLTVEALASIDGGSITDDSSPDPGPFDGRAEFTIDNLDVSGEENVELFRATFDNQDNEAFDEFEETSVTDLEGSTHDPGQTNSDFGDTYEITLQLEDDEGTIIDEVSLTVDADGNDISF